VNPFIEAASRNTIVPHDIPSMMLFHPTRIGTLNIQPRIAGDMALIGREGAGPCPIRGHSNVQGK
jgi:hypothetical protein